MWAKMILLLLCSACHPHVRLTKVRDSVALNQIKTDLSELSLLDWKVGPGIKKIKISKGFRFKLNLPRLEGDDALSLYHHHDVDAWLIRVVRFRKSGAYETLGHVYAPLVRTSLRLKTIKPSTLQSVYVNIVYAAVAPSKRFENFVCPAFGHNKIIEDAYLEKRENLRSTDSFFISPQGQLRSTAEKVSLAPAQFSGGTDLQGEYGVLLALYKVKGRELKSDFIQVDHRVVIAQEGQEYLKGCIDFKPPPRKPPAEKQFKFGN